MRVAALLILLLSLTSCSTFKENRRIQKCAKYKCVSDVKETIKEVIKDTTIYITEKGETKYLDNPCAELCDSLGNLKPFEKKIESKGRKVILYTKGNTLAVRSDLDSVEAKMQVKTVYKEKVVTVEVERKKNVLEKIQGYYFWLSLLVIALCLTFKFYRNKLPF